MNTYQRPILTLVSLLALLWQYGFSQSNEQCFDLEELYPDSTVMVGKATNTAAGEIIFQQETFSLSLDSFLYFDGSKGYENVWIAKELFGNFFLEQIFVFPSNINIRFDFASENEKLSNLCFNFYDGGGQVNISINGSPLLTLEDLTQLNEFDENPFGDDVTVSVEEFNNANFPSGKLCISGDITSLVIGGQEMGINNICYEVQDIQTADCPINNVRAKITACDDTGYQLLVDLDLDLGWYSEVTSDSFQLIIEGQDYGVFAYTQLPIQLEQVQIPTDGLSFEVAACDINNQNCCKNTLVNKSSCPGTDSDCIGFDEVEVGVYGSSTEYSSGDLAFSVGEIDFHLIGIPTLFWTTLFGDLSVVESDFPSTPFSEGPFLFFEGISVGMNFTQYAVPVEKVSIDVRLLEGPVNVSANGIPSLLLLDLTPDTYPIGPDVTLTVKENEADSTVNTLIFEGDIKSLLLGGMSMYADNLCINPEDPCNIKELSVSPTRCNSDGEFYVNLDFEYEGTADSFYVYQNGDSLGLFNYKWLPIKLGPFKGNHPDDPLYWVIEDANNESCVAAVRLEQAIECPPACPISSIKILDTECGDDGYHILTFDLSRDMTSEGEFTLFTEDGESRTYNYDELPISLKLPNNEDPTDISYRIKVCDNRRDDCCVDKTYRLSCGPCEIGELKVKPEACDENGQFYVKLDFEHFGNTSDSFYVYQGDQNLGLFNYKWLPVKLGPFKQEPGTAGTVFAVIDSEDPNCGNKTLLEPFDCPDRCDISNLKVEPTRCDENGNFYVYLNFEYQGTGKYFVLSQNGNEGRKVEYAELPLKLGPFSAYTDEERYWEVYDLDRPDCGGKVRLGPVDCQTEGCVLTNFTARAIECDERGWFKVLLNFKHQNTGKTFKLFQNGEEIGEYEYSQLPIILGPMAIPFDGSLYWEIVDAENEDCRARTELTSFHCEEICVIEKINILKIECLEVPPNAAEMYKITFDLDYEGGSEQFLVATSNGEEFSFSYDELPVSLTLPKSDAATPYRLKVCDSQYSDCCADVQYEVDCRQEECRIGELITEAYPCNDDGTFYVDLTFRYQNVSDSFYLYLPDSTLKVAYQDLPLKIGPFKGNSDQKIPIAVKDKDGDCGQRGFIVPANCGFNCSFQGLQAWTTECDENGQYYLKAQFRAYPSAASPGYYAFVQGEGFGPFSYEETELKLGPFDANTGSVNDLLLIDVLDPINCNAFVELAPVDCKPECGLREVAAKPVECTAEGKAIYILDIGFDGPDDQLIEVSTASESLGTVEAGSFPMEFEILIPENGQHPIFYFCVVGQDDCCARVEAELPDCIGISCELIDLYAEAFNCSAADGTFYVKVAPQFEGSAPGSPSFANYNVFFGSELVGTFPKADFPIEIGPFERRPGNGVYVFRVELAVGQTDPNFCRETTQVRLSDCFDDNECTIGDIDLSPLSCNPDGSYTLSLNFEYKNTDSDSFALSDKSGLLGIYALADLPINIEASPDTDSGIFEYEICIGRTALCCKGVEMEIPDCPPPPCPIKDIRMVVDDCNEKGELFLRIAPVLDQDVLHEDDLFAVYVYDRFVGVFPAEEFPLEVGPVARDAGDLSITIEQRGGNGECYLRKLFEPPYCEEKCDITDFNVQVLHCNPDGSYTFEVELKVENPNNKFFDLYGPQGYIGFYELDDLPLLVEVFIPDNLSNYVFEVCINDNPDCCARAEFELPECNDSCPVDELEAAAATCLEEDDDALSFKLDFELKEDVEGIKDSFYVFGLDSLYGPFAVADLPVEVGPVALDPDSIYQSGIIFEIRGLTENCSYAFRLAISYCPAIKVWPGDINTDRIANHRDLIYLGVAFGQQGPARGELTSSWEAIPSTPWAQSFEDDINLKHADCNGDGVVDIRDKAVIARNYGQTHGNVLDAGPLPNTDFAPPIFVDLPEEGELVSGSSFTIPIVLGTADNPVKDIYGFAFNIEFDPAFIDPEKVQVHYPVSWFGQEEVNVLTIDKIYREDGRIEIAMTRNDQNDVSGYGPVAYLKGIIADIAGIVDTRMETAQPIGISINAGKIPLGTQTTEIKLETYDDPYTILESFNMFPIPAGDVINFSNALDVPANEVRVFDLQGRQVLQTFKEVNEINVSELAAGMYLIRLKIQGIVINEKFLKR